MRGGSKPAAKERMAGKGKENAPKQSKECDHDTDGRHLVVSIDGTSNQFGPKNTNVIEFYSLLHKDEDDEQLCWYNSGIGTYAPPSWKSIDHLKKVLYNKVDLAIAWEFEKTVMGAYRWLSDNYQKGDTIYLFGFSRGAFQVRVLSAMIHKVGLIYKGNEMQIPFAYALYADPSSDEPILDGEGGTSPKPSILERFKGLLSREDHQALLSDSMGKISMAERFKKTFSRKDVKVHFVGAWDTVSSIGLARGKKLLPHTVDGMTHVCYFRHALALDERRVKFLPEYAYGGKAANPEPVQSHVAQNLKDSPSDQKAEPVRKRPQVKEVWFAGTHSDIGGGNVQNVGMNRSRPPLRWMVLEAEGAGLRISGFPSELSPKNFIEFRESLTWPWWPLEILPLKRLTFSRENDGNRTTRKPHLGRNRKIHPGQKIHASLVLAEPERPYTPKARPPPGISNFWQDLNNGLEDWLEVDVYEFVENKVDSFMASNDIAALESIRASMERIPGWAGPGRQVLYDKVMNVLQAAKAANPTAKYRLLKFALAFSSKENLRQPPRPIELTALRSYLSDVNQDSVQEYDRRVVNEFILKFTDRHVTTLDGHTHSVLSVAFSPDGRYLASGSADGTIRLSDTQTWQAVGEPFQGHRGFINSIVFSPDSKHIVSGSDDNTVRVWDVETGKAVGKPLEGHTENVLSVAYSPDGKFIASGSWDRTVRLWDAEKGEAVGKPLEGHGSAVWSVAFSPNGKLLASGLDDHTIRLWSIETCEPVGDPFRGHTGNVLSIAFSPDGKQIISGSSDETFRLWDVQTGKEDGRPFKGHTDSVWSVAFSRDGRRVVSGSHDKTVRLWDVATREMEGPPLTGHTDSVTSAVFSPDGRRVASGSWDRTIKIWDVED